MIQRAFFIGTFVVSVAAGSLAQTNETSFKPNHRDIQYGEAGGEKLLLDAHVPDGTGSFPVLLLVHGGGWCAGDKEGDLATVLGPAITNFTWFTINYRLAPKHHWPACFDDVQTAIRWVKKHADEYKGDSDRMALIGYSAGGHLVCYAATEATPETRVQAIVGCAPPADIVADAERRGSMDKWVSMKNLLDRDTLDADTKRIMREISPSERVTSDLPPFLLVQGSADTTVPYRLTLNFESELKAHNVSCQLITIPGAQHRIRDWHKYKAGWQEEIVAWLNQTLGSGKE